MKVKSTRSKIQFLIYLLTFISGLQLQAQSDQEVEGSRHFSGKALLTQNGISLVPSFSLDKPAILFNLSLGGEKVTFEPDIRFSLEGKPWSMLLWLRYKAIKQNKFGLRLGIHPGYNFRTIPVTSFGKNKDAIETRRFLAGEIVPYYTFNKHFQIGIYYLYSLGFDDSQKYTHFLVFNTGINKLPIVNDIKLSLYPSVFYLQLDKLKGTYFSSSFRLVKENFPFSVEAIINQIIDSEILPDRKFVWNVSLVYSFNYTYSKVR